MYIEVTRTKFHDYFNDSQYAGQFSYWGLDKLYAYLTDAEDEDHPLELDVVAIAVDFTEATYSQIMRDYDTGIELQDEDGDDRPVGDICEAVQAWLEYRTVVVATERSGNFVFACNF